MLSELMINLKSMLMANNNDKTTITKTDLIKAMSEKTKLTQKDVGLVLDAFMESVKESVSKGESVSLVSFGTFEVVDRAARKAVDFRTKEVINIPASKAVRFKVGKGLKEAVKAIKPKGKK